VTVGNLDLDVERITAADRLLAIADQHTSRQAWPIPRSAKAAKSPDSRVFGPDWTTDA